LSKTEVPRHNHPNLVGLAPEVDFAVAFSVLIGMTAPYGIHDGVVRHLATDDRKKTDDYSLSHRSTKHFFPE
jgi:hypothetical protein